MILGFLYGCFLYMIGDDYWDVGVRPQNNIFILSLNVSFCYCFYILYIFIQIEYFIDIKYKY